MKSTGEVMGVADNFGEAFAKAQLAAGQKLPTQGTVFISVTDHDKPHVVEVARQFRGHGIQTCGHRMALPTCHRRSRHDRRSRLQSERRPPQCRRLHQRPIASSSSSTRRTAPIPTSTRKRFAAQQSRATSQRLPLFRPPEPLRKEFPHCSVERYACKLCRRCTRRESLRNKNRISRRSDYLGIAVSGSPGSQQLGDPLMLRLPGSQPETEWSASCCSTS